MRRLPLSESKSPNRFGYELNPKHYHSNLQRGAIPFLVASFLAFRDPRVSRVFSATALSELVKCIERAFRQGISAMFFQRLPRQQRQELLAHQDYL
jgi:hypothetical protein